MQDLRLTGAGYASPLDLYASYAWDNMGRMTSLSYPLSGPQVAMNYDAMSNLSQATEVTCLSYDQSGDCLTSGPAPMASGTYNFAGQLTALNYNNFSLRTYTPGTWYQTETHTYNSLMQLTNTTSTTSSGAQSLNMTYNFSTTQNNGRIVSSSDAVTGENVSYTYDSLNRLIAAATTNGAGPIWGNSYSYDGFGNLTSKTVTQGTAPSASPQVNSATNQARMIGDYGFDANGNWLGTGSQSNAWNVENQLISNGLLDSSGNPFTNTYDPAGKRVLQYSVNASYGPWGTLYFYSITGQRLATYHLYYVTGTPTTLTTSMYFGGRLLAPVDRLGSVRGNANGSIAYFPWGEEEKQSTGYTTPDGTDKYATYFRDGTTNGAGQDYANARYYNNNFGRFWSPDPAGAAHVNDPQSWNLYAYGGNDPANNSDPSGLDTIIAPPCGVYAADDSSCAVTRPGPLCFSMLAGEGWEVFGCFGDGGGGTGGDQPTQPKKPPCPANVKNFVNAHIGDATTAADLIGTSPVDILALSGYESGWGSGPFMAAQGNYTGNAFFNLEGEIATPTSTTPTTLYLSTGWSQPSNKKNKDNQYAIVAGYANYYDAAMSFVNYKGGLFGNVTDPTAFGTIASKNGFGISVSTFVSIANMVANCLP
jgi:RHS repeat-associated protein